VHVRIGGVSEGPMDRILKVPTGNRKEPLPFRMIYVDLSPRVSEWNDPVRILRPEGRRSASVWYQSLTLFVYCR
jgi:hypothetical protein